MTSDVYQQFANLLDERLSCGVHTTEDSIRYTFFAALLSTGMFKPHQVIIEYPHSNISGAEVDTYLPPSDYTKEEVIEFKYHRQLPSGRNLPRPQLAGSLFKDIYRLIQFKPGTDMLRTFIYVTDTEMGKYLSNESNGLHEFFHLPQGERLVINNEYIRRKSVTFQNAVGVDLHAAIQCEFSTSISENHFIRIFRADGSLQDT